jgi:flagella basal body P-ring formation protein FlgA
VSPAPTDAATRPVALCGAIGRAGWVALLAVLAVSAVSAGAQDVARPVPAWLALVRQRADTVNAAAGLRTVAESEPNDPGPPACQRGLRLPEQPRTRWLGLVTVTLQCDQPAWRTAVTVRLRGLGPAVQASRALPAGARLTEGDLRVVEIDHAGEPPGVVSELAQALGLETTRPLREGANLSLNGLRHPAVIHAGDRISVRLVGGSFEVFVDATAQQQGAQGDTIRVKLSDGKMLQAQVVRAGQVELRL